MAETLDGIAAGTIGELGAVRDRTFQLVAHLDAQQLATVVDPIMSPLDWDLGHIAAYEDLWLCHRHGGLDLVRDDLAALYDAFETPRAVRGDLEILRGDELHAYLGAVRERAAEVTRERGLEPLLHELVLRHELQHTETMLQTMALAGWLPDSAGRPEGGDGDGMELVDVPAGPFAMGAEPGGFAYDNERDRRDVELPAFCIGRTPVTNASWLSFSEGGGYVRREWWSREGWAWKEEYDISGHPGALSGGADAPVVHVSWFEAEAFSRFAGARLPSEAEWEKAATSDLLEGVGCVWEWTASEFAAYPGFVARPYREYSEPFFDRGYRVLRGGSCATHPRVATTTFRNWDKPLRRQLFAGVRLAA